MMTYERIRAAVLGLPETERKKIGAAISASLKQHHRGGKPAIETPCPKCGAILPSVRAAGAHCRVSRK